MQIKASPPGPAEQARADPPTSQVEIVPGAPHSMYWETPALFNDAVGRFLTRVYATEAAAT